MAELLMGDQVITLVKHNKTDTKDTYSCYSMPKASWFSSVSIVTSADGAKPVSTYTVRIPAEYVPTGVIPATGDYVVRGVITSINRPSDLSGMEHFRVTAVGPNLRGLLSHWRVSGS